MPIKLHRDQFRWTNGRGHDQKPILYSQKANTFGLGKKQHNTDEWWTKAFDNQLKSLDVINSDSGEVTVKQTKTNATPIGMAITSRYTIKFVPGGILVGDVEIARAQAAAATVEKAEKADTEVKKARKARKDKKKENEKGTKTKSSRSSRESSTIDSSHKRKRKAEELLSRDSRRGQRRLKRLLDKEMAMLQALSVEA